MSKRMPLSCTPHRRAASQHAKALAEAARTLTSRVYVPTGKFAGSTTCAHAGFRVMRACSATPQSYHAVLDVNSRRVIYEVDAVVVLQQREEIDRLSLQ